MGMKYQTDDLRIREIKELLPPDHVLREFPITEKAAEAVFETRQAIHRILHGADDRLLAIMGPCSIHDVKAGKEYARKLKEAKDRLDHAVEIAPNVRAVWYERAKVNLSLKDYPSARADAEKALSLPDPGHVILDLQMYNLLEQIYRRIGENDLANKYAELSRKTPVPVKDGR